MSKGRKKEPENGFGERFRQLRLQKNLSQGEIGELVGLHYTNIGRYERGLSMPSAEAVNKLAEVLGVSSDYLLNGSKEEFAKAKFSDKDLLQMFQAVEQFPEEEKTLIKKIIDAFLTKKKLQELVGK
ncbi:MULTISPECIES: helix-turn-helix domain-containing protein [Leptospira]|uniref:DNA-binding helix-turn-helix protein n=3 Tax=Leptospira TaxID=171 RepID=M6FIF9_9LEPT|nr:MULTISPECIES: helix-turn-helix transcriptional regulator [Leptospira]EMM70907.1 DNA-binding helix-turn-helix protein [Leptospira weilii str. 2006001855]AXR62010.1 XRE family transcriptional regulator [Leptospira mayottensis]AXR62026.1 XRE family transcriptional regulator [Leptospira mayottensis]AXR62900.1 XRE family transcriptional regulator [Leptospira mayottensis]AXR63078.1 XRE family transcriptional regulator [Leptospira mayottensis]